MAVVNNTFLAPDFGLAQGFETFDYRGADNQDIRSAKESTDVALDWWGKTEGPKFLFWHVMEPHMDLLPPEETRGRLFPSPLSMCPLVLIRLLKSPKQESIEMRIKLPMCSHSMTKKSWPLTSNSNAS